MNIILKKSIRTALVGISFVCLITLVGCGNEDISKYRSNKIVASSINATYALTNEGTVLATGKDENGQLNVDSWSEIVEISASDDYVVGLREDGTVVSTMDIPEITNWNEIIDVSAGNSYLAALKKDGTVLTVGVSEDTKGEEEYVTEWNNIIAISQGNHDTLVGLKSDGTVVGCGLNYYGEIEVDNWRNIIQAETKTHFTAGLKSDGTVVCVGYCDGIECDVSGWTNIKQIDVQSCGIIGVKEDGTMVSTGGSIATDNKLIKSTDSSIETGLSVEGVSDVVAVDTSYNTVCTKEDGTVEVIGCFEQNGEKNVAGWKDIVSAYTTTEEIETIKKMEMEPFEVSTEKSLAEQNNEKLSRVDQENENIRINENAPIFIGMSSNDVYDELLKFVSSSEIEEEEGYDERDRYYQVRLSNDHAAELFDFNAIRKLPEIISVDLSCTEGILESISIDTKLPSYASEYSGSENLDLIERIAKDMGAKDKVSGSAYYPDAIDEMRFSGTTIIKGVGIKIYLTEERYSGKKSDVSLNIYTDPDD